MPRSQTYLAITTSCRSWSQRLKHPGKLKALSLPVPWGCGQLLGVLLTSTLSVHLVWVLQGGADRQIPHFPLPGHVDATWAGLHGPGLRRDTWPGMCWGSACLWPWSCGGNPKFCTKIAEAQLIRLAEESRCQVSLLSQLLCPSTQTPPQGYPKAARAQTAMSTGKSEGWQSTWGQ